MTHGDWHSPDDTGYRARWHVCLLEPLSAPFSRALEVEHPDSGKHLPIRAYGEPVEGEPVITCYLEQSLHKFLDDEVMGTLTALLSLSTQPVIRWE